MNYSSFLCKVLIRLDKDTIHKHKERPAGNPQALLNVILR